MQNNYNQPYTIVNKITRNINTKTIKNNDKQNYEQRYKPMQTETTINSNTKAYRKQH